MRRLLISTNNFVFSHSSHFPLLRNWANSRLMNLFLLFKQVTSKKLDWYDLVLYMIFIFQVHSSGFIVIDCGSRFVLFTREIPCEYELSIRGICSCHVSLLFFPRFRTSKGLTSWTICFRIDRWWLICFAIDVHVTDLACNYDHVMWLYLIILQTFLFSQNKQNFRVEDWIWIRRKHSQLWLDRCCKWVLFLSYLF